MSCNTLNLNICAAPAQPTGWGEAAPPLTGSEGTVQAPSDVADPSGWSDESHTIDPDEDIPF